MTGQQLAAMIDIRRAPAVGPAKIDSATLVGLRVACRFRACGLTERRQQTESDDPQLGDLDDTVRLVMAEEPLVLPFEVRTELSFVGRHMRYRNPYIPLLSQIAQIHLVADRHPGLFKAALR